MKVKNNNFSFVIMLLEWNICLLTLLIIKTNLLKTFGAIAHTNFKFFLILYTCVIINFPHSMKCNIKTQHIV